jgi:predicted nucleic acid-binding protein
LKIIVDTSIWSLALRRRSVARDGFVSALRNLVESDKAVMLGCIRQEILSGIRSTEQFTLLRDRLRPFPDEPLFFQDYERAAEFFNACRKRGIQGSTTDFLICAVAVEREHTIFTTDEDFKKFQRAIPVALFKP